MAVPTDRQKLGGVKDTHKLTLFQRRRSHLHPGSGRAGSFRRLHAGPAAAFSSFQRCLHAWAHGPSSTFRAQSPHLKQCKLITTSPHLPLTSRTLVIRWAGLSNSGGPRSRLLHSVPSQSPSHQGRRQENRCWGLGRGRVWGAGICLPQGQCLGRGCLSFQEVVTGR